MKASELKKAMSFSIVNNFPVLIVGQPGIGKSEIVEQACKDANAKLIISHPVVSDPTDYKGLPFPNAEKNIAEFLPFGELMSIVNATEKTVYFLDDLGQAPASVQAACMQLILARKINEHKVSDHVVFVAATNRREDKAGVSGILEPVKSRFASIIPLTFDIDSWVEWALKNNMPTELIAFAQFKPESICNFKPSKDMVNSACPRTVAYVGKMQNSGMPKGLEFDLIKGAAGEAFAIEYTAFIKVYMSLPSVQQIIMNPTGSPIPSEPSGQYAICGALAEKVSEQTIEPIIDYLDRFPKELGAMCLKNASIKNPAVCSTRKFISWASENATLFM